MPYSASLKSEFEYESESIVLESNDDCLGIFNGLVFWTRCLLEGRDVVDVVDVVDVPIDDGGEDDDDDDILVANNVIT